MHEHKRKKQTHFPIWTQYNITSDQIKIKSKLTASARKGSLHTCLNVVKSTEKHTLCVLLYAPVAYDVMSQQHQGETEFSGKELAKFFFCITLQHIKLSNIFLTNSSKLLCTSVLVQYAFFYQYQIVNVTFGLHVQIADPRPCVCSYAAFSVCFRIQYAMCSRLVGSFGSFNIRHPLTQATQLVGGDQTLVCVSVGCCQAQLTLMQQIQCTSPQPYFRFKGVLLRLYGRPNQLLTLLSKPSIVVSGTLHIRSGQRNCDECRTGISKCNTI